MAEYHRLEKECVHALQDVEKALLDLREEMRAQDFHIVSDQAMRVVYIRTRRAFEEIHAAKHFAARILAGKTVSRKPRRAIEDQDGNVVDPDTKEISK